MLEVIPRQIFNKIPTDSGNCNVHLFWNFPNNIALDDISHFTVHINGTHIANETRNANESSILTSYRLCSCGSHNISISAVNRCGMQSTLNIIVEDPQPTSQFPMQCQDTTTMSSGNECQGM